MTTSFVNMSIEAKYVRRVADSLAVPQHKVSSAIQMLDDGNTIPFIARYRKEATGSLDETMLREIEKVYGREKEFDARKEFILKTIEEQGKLSPSLHQNITDCTDTNLLEDLYLPFKKKRKTRAAKAIEIGLLSLADQIWRQTGVSPDRLASNFVKSKDLTLEEAMGGASDILAERVAEMSWIRQRLRHDYKKYGMITSKVVKGKDEGGAKYKDYFDHSERLNRCPSHRYLALLRAEDEGVVRLSIEIDVERSLHPIYRELITGRGPERQFIGELIDDAYKRLLAPSLENEVKSHFKELADQVAVDIFAKNLRQLLLSAPLGQKRVMALDPGFRTGCKLVIINKNGDYLMNSTIYPHPPQKQTVEAGKTLVDLCSQYKIQAVAIGNGTAGRETQTFINQVALPGSPDVFMVNENGASIYSASEVAREEFPDLDLTVRGSISIGRRLMDPLAELVKIDPKSIGVGQYQHDVNQKLLQDRLDATVESCVNAVGVNINTASKHLLKHIAGLGEVLAKNIVDYRRENGDYQEINELQKVPRLGQKAFEQCAGFLRIRNGKNPLDNTGVHPEAYPIVSMMARQMKCDLRDLIEKGSLLNELDLEVFANGQIGLPTLKDIRSELLKPGLDPRGEASSFKFHPNIRSMEDLNPGTTLPGLVTNLTNFGAFVDIGIKQDGLIHISQMSDKRIHDPSEILSLNQQVRVKVLDVDVNRKRIQLALVKD